MQGTFREHSGNIQGTFRNIQGTVTPPLAALTYTYDERMKGGNI
jgi:hypothetical protein